LAQARGIDDLWILTSDMSTVVEMPQSESVSEISEEMDNAGAGKTHAAEKESMEPWSIAPILLVQFLYMLALAMSAPNYPFIWTTMPYASGDEVKGATLSLFGVFSNAFAEFLSASLLGVMSDRYGRKPFLLLSCLGQVIDFTTAGLAVQGLNEMGVHLPTITAHLKPVCWMLSARVIAGLCGNLTIFTKAYVGDVSTAETSSKHFALLFACVISSVLVGMPLGGVLSRRSLRAPMMAASALNLMNMILVCFLRESLKPEHRTPVVWRRANPVGVLQFLLSSRFLLFFGIMTFMDQFSISLIHNVFFQYCKIVFEVEKRSSIMLIITFCLASIISLVLIQCPMILRRCGEITIVRAGYSLTCAAFACLALVSYTRLFLLMFPCMILLAVGAVSGPVQTAIATRCVTDSEQGTLQAANGSLDVIGKMASAGLVSVLFQPVMKIDQPGIIWWTACLTALGGVWIAFNLHRFLPPTFKAFPSSLPDASEP